MLKTSSIPVSPLTHHFNLSKPLTVLFKKIFIQKRLYKSEILCLNISDMGLEDL